MRRPCVLVCAAIVLSVAVASCATDGAKTSGDGGAARAPAADAASTGDAATPLDASGSADAASDARAARSDASGVDGSISVAPSGLSEFGACMHYFAAVCAQRYACFGETYQCEVYKQHCPDRFFSPGSTFTPDMVVACSQGWERLSCADLADGMVPDCGSHAGTRPNGESCVFPSQCASSRCSGTLVACGQCVDAAPLGSACTGENMCTRSTYCATSSTKVCTARPAARRPGRARRGEVCTDSEGCEYDYTCVAPAGSPTGICTRAVAGVRCAGGTDCVDGAYCPRQLDPVCLPLPALGQPCSDERSGPARCAQGARCGDNDLCVPRIALGGTHCHGEEDCAEGSTCAEPTPQGIWTCLHYGNEGDPCSGPYDRCNLGLECKSAVCTPVASRGFFTTACMP